MNLCRAGHTTLSRCVDDEGRGTSVSSGGGAVTRDRASGTRSLLLEVTAWVACWAAWTASELTTQAIAAEDKSVAATNGNAPARGALREPSTVTFGDTSTTALS